MRTQKLNIATNLIYVVPTFAALVRGVETGDLNAFSVAAACGFVGVASWLWHSEPENETRRLRDEVSMYVVSLAIICSAVGAPPYVLPVIAVVPFVIADTIDSDRFLPILISIAFGAMLVVNWIAALASLACMIVAFVVVDPEHEGTTPSHAARHVLTALGLTIAIAAIFH